MRTIEESLQQIKQFWAEHTGEDWRFKHAATEAQITAQEIAAGLTLPLQLKSLYGICSEIFMSPPCDVIHIQAVGVDLVSKNDKIKAVAPIRLYPGVRFPEFGKNLIPFATCPNIDICIDLDPAKGGASGQIIVVDYEEPACKVIANSLEDFFEHCADFYKKIPDQLGADLAVEPEDSRFAPRHVKMTDEDVANLNLEQMLNDPRQRLTLLTLVWQLNFDELAGKPVDEKLAAAVKSLGPQIDADAATSSNPYLIAAAKKAREARAAAHVPVKKTVEGFLKHTGSPVSSWCSDGPASWHYEIAAHVPDSVHKREPRDLNAIPTVEQSIARIKKIVVIETDRADENSKRRASPVTSRIEELVLKVYGPEDYGFKKGLEEKDIKAVEIETGIKIPVDLYRLYQSCSSIMLTPVLNISSVKSLDSHVRYFNEQIKQSPPVKLFPGVCYPIFGVNLVPFGSLFGAILAADLNPAESGLVGQIVAVNFREATCKIVADNLADFFDKCASFYENAYQKFNSSNALRKTENLKNKEPSSERGKTMTLPLMYMPEKLLALRKKLGLPLPGETISLHYEEPEDSVSFSNFIGEIKSPVDGWCLDDPNDWHYDETSSVAEPELEPLDIMRLGFVRKPDVAETLKLCWDKIRTLSDQLAECRDDVAYDDSGIFESGLSDYEIQKFEADKGLPLPEQIRASLKVCYLQPMESLFQLDWHGCLSMEDCLELNATVLGDLDDFVVFPGTRKPVFGRNLIPFASSRYVHLCVDMNPGAGGKVGQIVEVSHFDESTIKVVATDFLDWLMRGILFMLDELDEFRREAGEDE